MIDLSIVIVSWNTCELTLACIESIEREVWSRRDAGRIECEVLLVDNASADETVASVRSRFPKVIILAQTKNLGFAAGNNVGFRKAQGRHILLLNSDTVLKYDSLECMVRYLDTHSEVGAVGPQLLNADGSKQNCIHNFPSLATEFVPKGLLERLFPARFPSKRFVHTQPIAVDAVLGACLMVRREVIERVGPMPEEYFLFLEETDWCWSMQEAGFRVMHLPSIEVLHHSGASSKKRIRAATRIEYHRSLYLFLRKRRGWLAMALVWAYRLIKNFFYLVVLALPSAISLRQRDRWQASVAVFAWHFAGCPADAGLRTARLPTRSSARGAVQKEE